MPHGGAGGGRRPNTEGLFGEGFSLEMERGRIVVDEAFQTSVPGVYAIGGVSSRIQLAHAATAQGIASVDRLALREPLVDVGNVPSCIYTSPEIASIGLTAKQLARVMRPHPTYEEAVSDAVEDLLEKLER